MIRSQPDVMPTLFCGERYVKLAIKGGNDFLNQLDKVPGGVKAARSNALS